MFHSLPALCRAEFLHLTKSCAILIAAFDFIFLIYQNPNNYAYYTGAQISGKAGDDYIAIKSFRVFRGADSEAAPLLFIITPIDGKKYYFLITFKKSYFLFIHS